MQAFEIYVEEGCGEHDPFQDATDSGECLELEEGKASGVGNIRCWEEEDDECTLRLAKKIKV
jgi:hypothetical protein